MRNTVLLATLALVLIGLLVGSALAEESRENDSEIAAVAAAKVSLAAAVTAAEQHTGGRAVGTGLAHHEKSFAYAVKVANKGNLDLVFVSLESGKVLRVEHEGPLDQAVESAKRAAYYQQNPAAGDLAALVGAVEKALGGQVLEADYSACDKLYEVEILAADKGLHTAKVDPATRQVVKVSPGESEEDDD